MALKSILAVSTHAKSSSDLATKVYVQNYDQRIGFGTRNVKSHDVLVENLLQSEVLNVYDYTLKC